MAVVAVAGFAAVIPHTWAGEVPVAPSAGTGRSDPQGPPGNATLVGEMPATSGPRAAARAPLTVDGQVRAVAAAVEPPPGTPGPVVSAVVRDRNVMDIFGVDAGQRIYTASWKPDHTEGWHRWAQLNGGMAAPGTSVYGVSRQKDELDIFAVGTDRRVYSAAWNPSLGTQWGGWWRIGDLTVAPNTSVHAVTSVSQNRIDLFAVGSDKKVYTATWRPSTGWVAWTRLDGTTVRANTMVYGVYRSGGEIDIFTVDTNAHIVWARSWTGATWDRWRTLAMDGYTVTAGSSVYPVSRHPEKIDIFTVAERAFFLATDVVTASYNKRAAGEGWSGLSNVANGQARAGSTVFAGVRRTDFVDVFVVGRAGRVYTTSSDNGAPYQEWQRIGNMTTAPGTSVFATNRNRDHLDVFGIDANAGTYTAAFTPTTSAWSGWSEVGPHGQAGENVLTTADINLTGGVSGWSTLRISSGGAWEFRGRLHNSGVPSYIVGLVWTVSVPSGKVFTFKMGADLASLAHPEDQDGRTKTWSVTGASNDVAQHWNEIQSSGTWSWRANSDVDMSDLVLETITALGYIATVVAIVSLF
jgi:hypothetical protein